MAFTDPLHLMPVPQTGKYCVIRPLSYHIGFLGSELVVTVPEGFLTDLASVPRALWFLVPPHSPDYAAAAVLHDYLYEWKEGMFTRVVADGIFYEAMRVLGVAKWRAIIMYLAVRLWNNWDVNTVGLK